MRQFYRDFTTHTPTFQQFGNPFVVCNPYASHLAVGSSMTSQYWFLLEKYRCFLTGKVVTVTPHSFKNSVTRITKSIYTEAIDFLLSTSGNNTFIFAIWLTLLKIPQSRILKGASRVLASCESHGFRIVLPSRIQSSRPWLRH